MSVLPPQTRKFVEGPPALAAKPGRLFISDETVDRAVEDVDEKAFISVESGEICVELFDGWDVEFE
jgi:hypothetical protein